jgi:hypothetical protein
MFKSQVLMAGSGNIAEERRQAAALQDLAECFVDAQSAAVFEMISSVTGVTASP